MSIKSHHILTFFFAAFALIALSACTVGTDSGKQPKFYETLRP